MNISDTEEGVEMSGIVKTQVQLSSYGVSFTRTFESISYKKDRENFIVESGKISADVRKQDNRVIKVNVYLNEFCSCEHEVEIEKMVNENWILFKSIGNICEAKKKQENETLNDIIRGST